VWVAGAVLRERARKRGLLLLVAVLLLLVVYLQENLPRLHAVAEIRQDPADFAVRFRGNGDLIDGGERADHVDGAPYRFLPDRFHLDRFCRSVLAARLRGLRLGTAGK